MPKVPYLVLQSEVGCSARMGTGLTHLPVHWAASLGTADEGRGLQTQREEGLLTLDVQGELDLWVRGRWGFR